MKKSGKKLLIVLIIIALIAIAGGAVAYTYFCTDVFKSGQELFAKYLIQNVEDIKNTITLDKVEEIENKLKESKYEQNIEISYAENESDKSNVEITIDTQNDAIEQKVYGNLSLTAEQIKEPLKLEYMQEDNIYSLRFNNSVQQFLSVENRNIKQFAKKLGIDESIIKEIPNKIEMETSLLKEIEFTEEEINKEIEKYVTLLYSNIAKENYQKNKNVVITVNGETLTTNAYVLTLSLQEIQDLEIKLLEALKQDEIVLAKLEAIDDKIKELGEESIEEQFVKTIQEKVEELQKRVVAQSNVLITIYEKEKEVVRIKAEKGLESATLDTTVVEGKKQIDLNYVTEKTSNRLTIIRENANKISVQINNVNGEEKQSSKLEAELIENENSAKMNIVLETEEGTANFERNITFVDKINYDITVDDTNSIILNDVSAERIQALLTAVGARVTIDYIEPITKVYNMLFSDNVATDNNEKIDIES